MSRPFNDQLVCLSWCHGFVCRMERTTSPWQQTQTFLQWPLTPGAPATGPRAGSSWMSSSTMTARRLWGQCHNFLFHLGFIKGRALMDARCLMSPVQRVPAGWAVQSAPQHQDVWTHRRGKQQHHGALVEWSTSTNSNLSSTVNKNILAFPAALKILHCFLCRRVTQTSVCASQWRIKRVWTNTCRPLPASGKR